MYSDILTKQNNSVIFAFLKKSIAYLFYSLLALSFFGQNVISLEEKNLGVSFATQAQIVEDANKEYSAERILDNSDINFKNITHAVEKIEFTNSRYWVRFEIENKTDFTSFVLETARPATNKVVLYEIANGKIVKTLKSGDDFSFSEKEIRHRLNVFGIEMEKGESKSFVLQLESDGETLVFPLILHESHQFWEADSTNQFVYGIYYGILILVVIIYFFFYRLMQNRSFLYYILYVLSILALQFSLDGYIFEYIFPSGGYLPNHSVLFTASWTLIFLVLYARNYLNTAKNAIALDKGFKVLMWLMLVLMLISLIPGKLYEVSFPLINGFSLLGVILILVAIFSVRKKGVKVSIYFTSAFVILIAGAILFILGNFHLLENDGLTSNALKISSVMEVIALSISMAYKYKELQQEKELAQVVAMEGLEKEVKTRTFELEKQKHALGEKNQEIVDSINYAKRLQSALIPPISVFKEILPESFVLFEPKDIVSGDFYWITKVTTTVSDEEQGEELILFSAADCTGHGVPGAFMSIIGIQIFNQSMKNPDVNSTAEALDFLNKEVYNAVNRHQVGDTVVRDGMDLALCAFNPKSLQLYYTGAKNPIYIVRNKELTIIKADKQPIGSNENPEPFTQNTYQLEKGDMVYLFTDGLPDQFGGPRGKKFKYKQFQEILIGNSQLPPEEQKQVLLNAFNSWKGDLEQLDDVCVIGVGV